MSNDIHHDAHGASLAAPVSAPEPAAPSAPRVGSYAPTTIAAPALGSYDPAPASDVDESPVGDVLDVDGATRLLRIGRNTVYALVARNEIPHRRVGKQIRFHRATIMQWLSSWSPQVAKKRRQ